MGWFGWLGFGPKEEAKPARKICCACPETKKPRDDCIGEHGPDDPRCIALIEKHKECLRKEGFNV